MKDKLRVWVAFAGLGLFVAAVVLGAIGAFIAPFWWFYLGIVAGIMSLACFRLSEKMLLSR